MTRTLAATLLLAGAAAAGDIATELSRFPVLARLVREAGLEAALRTPGPFTLLAPPEELLAQLELTPAQLVGLLSHHVVDGKPAAAGEAVTLHGQPISWEDIEGARGRTEPVACTNGVIVPLKVALTPERIEEGARLAAGGEFRVRIEAPLPVGWPRPGPVAEVRLKQYPHYRLARDDGGRFWTLFRHIERNEIAMTAPVEMGMEQGNEGPRTQSMAFLYRHPAQGSAGKDGAVVVEDRVPRFALSIGVRGGTGGEVVADAVRALRAELARRPGWREAPDGLSLFGFNSPMVLGRARYWEVALWVEPAPVRVAPEE